MIGRSDTWMWRYPGWVGNLDFKYRASAMTRQRIVCRCHKLDRDRCRRGELGISAWPPRVSRRRQGSHRRLRRKLGKAGQSQKHELKKKKECRKIQKRRRRSDRNFGIRVSQPKSFECPSDSLTSKWPRSKRTQGWSLARLQTTN